METGGGEGLQALLKSQLEDGVVESTASFTIDSLRARRKLASSQLPEHGLWLVKLVQAAVAANARRIEISFGKRMVEFRFLCPEWEWEPRRIVDLLLSGELPKEPFLFHLLAGLRGSILDDTLNADWSVSRPQGNFKVTFSGEGTELLEEAGQEREEACFVLRTSRPPRWPGFKKAAAMPIKHLLRRTAEEFVAVHNHCWCCPVPIKLDGRPLPNRYRPLPSEDEAALSRLNRQMSGQARLGSLPTILTRRELPSISTRPDVSIPWAQDRGERVEVDCEFGPTLMKKTVYMGQTWLEIGHRSGPQSGAAVLLLYGFELDSRVEFICDGAVVDSASLPWRSRETRILGKHAPQNAFKVGVRVLVAVQSSELDLSQFKVREPEEILKASLPQIRDSLEQITLYCLENRKSFRFRAAPRADTAVGAFVSGVMGTTMMAHPIYHWFTGPAFKAELNSLLESLLGPE